MKAGYKVILVGCLIFSAHTAHKKEVDRFHHDLRQQRITYEGMLTAQEIRLKDYFAAHGSPEPANAAKAVGRSKRPIQTAVIAKRESRANPKAVGDGGKSRGMYQVQGKYWGRVPKSMDGQTDQHDKIMDDLVASSDPVQAIQNYNGAGPKAREYKRETVKETIRLAQELGIK